MPFDTSSSSCRCCWRVRARRLPPRRHRRPRRRRSIPRSPHWSRRAPPTCAQQASSESLRAPASCAGKSTGHDSRSEIARALLPNEEQAWRPPWHGMHRTNSPTRRLRARTPGFRYPWGDGRSRSPQPQTRRPDAALGDLALCLAGRQARFHLPRRACGAGLRGLFRIRIHRRDHRLPIFRNRSTRTWASTGRRSRACATRRTLPSNR